MKIIKTPAFKKRAQNIGMPPQDKLDRKTISKINAEIRSTGLDGNGRFKRPGDMIGAISRVLSKYGLGIAESLTPDNLPEIHTNPEYWKTKGNTNTVNIPISKNPSQVFTEGTEIQNTSIHLSYTLLRMDPTAGAVYDGTAYLA